MNIHHLELFYYVARHGGITRALKHIPYGIQQPAVSSQILQLENTVEAKLFERSPFQLTAEGEHLFAFVSPFFENLGRVAAELSSRASKQLRIGASELVLRDHLPSVMHRVRSRHSGIRLAMHSGLQPQLESQIREQKLDVAIVTVLQERLGKGLHVHPLVRMPLVLLVHRDSPIKSADELWTRRKIDDPLICLPASGGSFQKGLQRLKVKWQPSIEASSLQLVTWYVANGYGIGVNVNVPDVIRHADVRVLPLVGFDPVEIVGIWRGQLSPLVRTVLEEAQAYCRESWPHPACGIPLERATKGVLGNPKLIKAASARR